MASANSWMCPKQAQAVLFLGKTPDTQLPGKTNTGHPRAMQTIEKILYLAERSDLGGCLLCLNLVVEGMWVWRGGGPSGITVDCA